MHVRVAPAERMRPGVALANNIHDNKSNNTVIVTGAPRRPRQSRSPAQAAEASAASPPPVIYSAPQHIREYVESMPKACQKYAEGMPKGLLSAPSPLLREGPKVFGVTENEIEAYGWHIRNERGPLDESTS
eukprot:3535788-Pyramimonas_sp.AAC.1